MTSVLNDAQVRPANGPSSAEVAASRAPRPRLSTHSRRILSILIGGGAGALTRAGVAAALPQAPGSWPWATFGVNLGGALFLGWLLTRLTERVAVTAHWRTLLGTGLCGGLTTFSTFQIDTITLAREGHAALAVAYAAVSTAAGLACAVTGTVAARWGRYG